MRLASGSVVISRFTKKDTDSEDYLSVDLLHVGSVFESVWQGRIDLEWEGGMLTTVSREGLIALKRLRNSGQDQDDIRKLKQF